MSSKKPTGSHRPVGAAVLAERIEKLKEELAGVADEIAEVTGGREAVWSTYHFTSEMLPEED